MFVESLLLDDVQGAVVVTMPLMGKVQVAVHQVADVIAMGNGLVATTRAVNVVVVVTATFMIGSAGGWIFGRDFDHVMLYVGGALGVMQVTVVQIVHVIAVLDGYVAAALTVFVVVMIAVVIMSHG